MQIVRTAPPRQHELGHTTCPEISRYGNGDRRSVQCVHDFVAFKESCAGVASCEAIYWVQEMVQTEGVVSEYSSSTHPAQMAINFPFTFCHAAPPTRLLIASAFISGVKHIFRPD